MPASFDVKLLPQPTAIKPETKEEGMENLFVDDPTPEEEPVNSDDARASWKQKVPASYWDQFKRTPRYWKPPVPINYHAFFDDDFDCLLTVEGNGRLRIGSLAVRHRHVKLFWNRIHNVLEPVDFARVCECYSDIAEGTSA